ncbi:MAG: MaoC family dehydratase, partial [Deltaproteobacteria bacterium]
MAEESPASSRRIVERGRYYEDFNVGDVYRHHWGRT